MQSHPLSSESQRGGDRDQVTQALASGLRTQLYMHGPAPLCFSDADHRLEWAQWGAFSLHGLVQPHLCRNRQMLNEVPFNASGYSRCRLWDLG